MEINFDTVIKTLKDQPLKNVDEHGVVISDMTLADVSVNALLNMARDDKIDGRKKQQRYNLAKKVNCGGIIELKPSDVSMLTKLIGDMYNPLVVGQAFELFGEKDNE